MQNSNRRGRGGQKGGGMPIKKPLKTRIQKEQINDKDATSFALKYF
jgi:hypothetical protein